jgi:hypothetical protein
MFLFTLEEILHSLVEMHYLGWSVCLLFRFLLIVGYVTQKHRLADEEKLSIRILAKTHRSLSDLFIVSLLEENVAVHFLPILKKGG